MSKGTKAQTISKRSSKASVVGKRTDVVEVKAQVRPQAQHGNFGGNIWILSSTSAQGPEKGLEEGWLWLEHMQEDWFKGSCSNQPSGLLQQKN